MEEFWHALTSDKKIALTVLVAALGYFVDVYDLVLFSVLRVASLKDMGVVFSAAVGVGRVFCSGLCRSAHALRNVPCES